MKNKNIGHEIVNLKAEALHLSEDTKVLKINRKKIKHKNHISTITTSFEELIKKMSVNKNVGRKIKPAKFEPKKTIEMKNYEIKADHMKNISSLDMKTSSIYSKQNIVYLIMIGACF